MIRIAGIIEGKLMPPKIYFLIGYAEEMLTLFLQSNVKLELQTVSDKKKLIFTYI